MYKTRKKLTVLLCLTLLLSGMLNFKVNLGFKSSRFLEPRESVYAAGIQPQVVAGGDHTLLLKNDGTVWAWGRNNFGQLGDGSTTDKSTPVQVTGIDDIVSIVGGYHSIALRVDGTVWTWGYNGYGQLGDGAITDKHTPVQVTGLDNVVSIERGNTHSIAVKEDGTVWTWGRNYNGQLGDGTRIDRSTPVQVTGLTNVASIAGGYFHSIALSEDGTVWAWGDNENGQLGNGSIIDAKTPVQVTGLTNVVSISSGGNHNIALKEDGTVWAWGYNNYGQLGDGTTSTRYTPVQVSGLTNVVSIAGGSFHSIAIKEDGTVWTWGYNNEGQMGDGTTTNKYTPVQVTGLDNIVSISGSYHNIALKEDRTVWTWGSNEYGELGDGTTTYKHTPIKVDINVIVNAIPIVDIIYPVKNNSISSNSTLSMTIQDDDNDNVTCSAYIDGVQVGTTKMVVGTENTQTINFTDLDLTTFLEGEHTVAFSYDDGNGGNGTTEPITVTIDKTLPSIGNVEKVFDYTTPTTVVDQTYDTSGNGGRKLVRLSDGTLYSIMIGDDDTFNDRIMLYKSLDRGNTWDLVTAFSYGVDSCAIDVDNNENIYVAYSRLNRYVAYWVMYQNGDTAGGTIYDSGNSTDYPQNTVALAIGKDENIHVTWRGKYYNHTFNYNIFYSKSTDGGSTWSTVEHITGVTNSNYDYNNPLIIINNLNEPSIVFEYRSSTHPNNIFIMSKAFKSRLETNPAYNENWGNDYIYYDYQYSQFRPSSVVDSNGVIHVVWSGKDSIDSNATNIRYSKSTDGGVSWTSMEKLTNGDSDSQYYPSVTVDNKKIYILWYGKTNGDNTGVYQIKKISNDGNGWSEIENLTSNTIGSAQHLSTCSNYRDFEKPLAIWQDYELNQVSFYGKWTEQTIASPTPVTFDSTDKTISFTGSATDDRELDPLPYRYSADTNIGNTGASDWTAETSYTLGNLTPNTNYTAKFEAKDSAENISEMTQNINTKAQTPVFNITAVDDSISLQFTDNNPSYTEYQIISGNEYIDSSGHLTDIPTWITLTDKKITIMGLQTGKNYEFIAKARNVEGIETSSSEPGNMTVQVSIPQNILAVSTKDKVTLTWDKVEGAIGYEIDADGNITTINEGTTLSYIHEGLTPNTLHTYKVRSVSMSGKSNWSEETNILTKQSIPDAPQNIIISPKNKEIEISWDRVPFADSYQIEVDGRIIDIGKMDSYKHTGLLLNSQHTYRIRGINEAGAGKWSQLNMSSTTYNPPNVPQNIKEYVSKTEIMLSWDKEVDTVSYEIEENGKIYNIGDNTYFIKIGLEPNTTMTYRVRGKNEVGTSSWSDPITVTTYILETPSGISKLSHENKITLSWDAVADGENYEIEIDGQVPIEIADTTYTHESLEPLSTHTYRIRAKNVEGIGGWTYGIIATTLPQKPPTPLNLAAIVSHNMISLSWDSILEAISYDVEINGVLIDNGNNTTYIHEDLTTSSNHAYRVRAKNTLIDGDFTEMFLVSTLPEKPTSPQDIRVATSRNITEITWSDVPNTMLYEIEVDGSVTKVKGETSFAHRGITLGNQHIYRLRTISSMGTSDWSGKILNSTFIAQSQKDKEINLGLTASNIEDFENYRLMLTYNPDVLQVEDLCALTDEKELSIGKIEGTDIEITEFSPGKIEFVVNKTITLGESWTGVINNIKLKGKIKGGTPIMYTVYEILNK